MFIRLYYANSVNIAVNNFNIIQDRYILIKLKNMTRCRSVKLPKHISDLNFLIQNEVQENIHLYYKDSRSISKKNRKEIAKDVSAFANSDGGILIYGIREEGHLPVEIDHGVDHRIFTREWMEEVITSNIAPIIDDINIVQIPLSKSHSVYAIQIPKSYRAPHQEQPTKRYYKRHKF